MFNDEEDIGTESLVYEALRYMSQQRELGIDTNDYLTIYAFHIEGDITPSQYAQLGVEINRFFLCQSNKDQFLWDDGIECPTFNFHVIDDDDLKGKSNKSKDTKRPFGCTASTAELSDDEEDHSMESYTQRKERRKSKFPCLKSVFRFNNSNDDVWYACSLLLKLSNKFQNLAFEFLEGPLYEQILLIEAAKVLPSWAANAGPDGCRHRVWVIRGKCCLIAPRNVYYIPSPGEKFKRKKVKPLELQDALKYLQYATSKDGKKISPSSSCAKSAHDFAEILFEVPSAIQDAIISRIQKLDLEGRYHRAAVILPHKVARLFTLQPQLLARSLTSYFGKNQSQLNSLPGEESESHDLVFVVLRFTKLMFAMITSCVQDDGGIKLYKDTPKVDSLHQICNSSSNSHLKYSFDIGCKLFLGFKLASSKHEDKLTDHKIKEEWDNLCVKLDYTSDYIMFSEMSSFSDMKKKQKTFQRLIGETYERIESTPEINIYRESPPLSSSVDNDDWLIVTKDEFEDTMLDNVDDTTAFEHNTVLDEDFAFKDTECEKIESVLKSFDGFRQQSQKKLEKTCDKVHLKEETEVNIDTSKFLNILNGTFHDLRHDEYFSDEDSIDSTSENDNDAIPVSNEVEGDSVLEIMRLMDEELQESCAERYMQTCKTDVDVLSNIFGSLDVEADFDTTSIIKELES